MNKLETAVSNGYVVCESWTNILCAIEETCKGKVKTSDAPNESNAIVLPVK